MKTTKLYNVILPIWWILCFPITPFWFVILLGNALIDSLVLLLGCKINRRSFWDIWKKCFLKTYIFGYAADLIGCLLMLLLTFILPNSIANAINFNPFADPLVFAITLLVVIFSGFLIYHFNMKLNFKNTDLTVEEKKKAAYCLAIITAPYCFMIPVVWFL